MIHSPIFVCFYTWDYRHHATGLRLSLDARGLSHDLHLVTSRGSWQANCQRKPAFLRAMLAKHKGPIVWVDADARVRQRPDLLIEMAAMRHADVAVHNYTLAGGRSETLSGTVYLDEAPATYALLDAWQERCKARPGEYDQESLGWALEWMVRATSIRAAELPAEYCFVFDIFRGIFYRRNHPHVGEPVIEHLQHSRVVRRKERQDA